MVYNYSIVFETATQLQADEFEYLKKQVRQEKHEEQKTVSNSSILSKPIDDWCKTAIRAQDAFLDFDFKGRPKHTSVIPQPPSKPVNQEHLSLDWRFGKIEFSGIDMDKIPANPVANTEESAVPSAFTSGPSTAVAQRPRSKSMIVNTRPDLLKARFLGYGIIRLYRDDDDDSPEDQIHSKKKKSQQKNPAESTSTTLAILAVPSYMTPYDFIGFIGSNACDNVSHFRMVRTAQPNRYLVLMKFRNPEYAKQFQDEYNGKLFNSMEAETCQVVSITRVEFRNYNSDGQRHLSQSVSSISDEIPYLMEDPFTLAAADESAIDDQDEEEDDDHDKTVSRELSINSLMKQGPPSKPVPPPTPILTELPTCPVCLERMDATTTGLLTIPCQHTFHCQCLSKWKDGSCPVCRYSQLGASKTPGRCAVCQARENLWICLICGHIGCGRYDNAHAFDHYEATGHCYAMDLDTQRVWDYLSDGYVHRLLQSQTDGKLLELPGYPGASSGGEGGSGRGRGAPWGPWGDGGQSQDPAAAYDVANAAVKAADNSEKKLADMSMHLTQLLSSQLESQRDYYESLMAASADKTMAAVARSTKLERENAQLIEDISAYKNDSVPDLKKELEKTRQKADKLHKLCTKLEESYKEEKLIGEQTIIKLKRLEEQAAARDAEMAELNETVRDLMFFHEAQAKLQNAGEDIQEGTIVIPEQQQSRGSSSKGRKNRR